MSNGDEREQKKKELDKILDRNDFDDGLVMVEWGPRTGVLDGKYRNQYHLIPPCLIHSRYWNLESLLALILAGCKSGFTSSSSGLAVKMLKGGGGEGPDIWYYSNGEKQGRSCTLSVIYG